jgi:hypothetical protein
MCVSCGCGVLSQRDGDCRHITLAMLQGAAEAAGISLDRVIANIATFANSSAQLESAEWAPYMAPASCCENAPAEEEVPFLLANGVVTRLRWAPASVLGGRWGFFPDAE